MVECIFIGGMLHGERAWLERADKLLWRPLSEGQVAAYGLRESPEGSARVFYAPIGFSAYQYQHCLDDYFRRELVAIQANIHRGVRTHP